VCVCSENSREFGILRALGLSVPEVMRVFLYEAIAVVLSSFFLGTVIGTGPYTSSGHRSHLTFSPLFVRACDCHLAHTAIQLVPGDALQV
jgi:FtsX-like permease family